MIDLHGLYVGEALGYAERQLAELEDDEVVRFIVGMSFEFLQLRGTETGFEWPSPNLGKGLHTFDGKAKIGPALEEHCEEYVRDPRVLHIYQCCILTLVDLRLGFTCYLDPENSGILIVHC